jgi:integrase/recombinase XerD
MTSSLRQRMSDDMRLRNLSPKTVESYLLYVRLFAEHFDTAPDQLGPDHARAFLLHLLCERQLSPSTVNVARSAITFFYRVTLAREDVTVSIPLARRGRKLPTVLSPEDVGRLLEGARSRPRIRTMLLLAYATGLRLSEVLSLRITEVDRERMVIHVRQGKGRRDRLVLLSPRLLEELRDHWRREHRGRAVPSVFLFPSALSPDRHVNESTLQHAVTKIVAEVGLPKGVTFKTMRHCFATHLLEAHTDLHVIQHLLGHSDIHTTQQYTQISSTLLRTTFSPLDRLAEHEAATKSTTKPRTKSAARSKRKPTRAKPTRRTARDAEAG